MLQRALRLSVLLLLAACTSSPAASPASSPAASHSPLAGTPLSPASQAPSPTTAPTATPSPVGHGPAGLVSDLRAAGMEVEDAGGFDGGLISRLGTLLCVAGEPVRVYVFGTPQEATAMAQRIDPTDPGNFGTVIIEWTGEPRFWLRDRIIVLYLGSDDAVTQALVSVLGEPFARSTGRGPMLPEPDC